MSCKHKFVHRNNDSYYRAESRYSYKYTSIDYYYCEKCLEEKEVRKEESVQQGHEVPDWAKTITKKVAGYEYY